MSCVNLAPDTWAPRFWPGFFHPPPAGSWKTHSPHGSTLASVVDQHFQGSIFQKSQSHQKAPETTKIWISKRDPSGAPQGA